MVVIARKVDLDLRNKTVGHDLRGLGIVVRVPIYAKTALIDGDNGEPVLLTGRDGGLGEFDDQAPFAMTLRTSGAHLGYQLQMRGFTVRTTWV